MKMIGKIMIMNGNFCREVLLKTNFIIYNVKKFTEYGRD